MKYLLLFLLSTTMLRAQGADSLNMTLVGQLNPVTGTGPHASLWGYTAPDGREYALFASQIGTHVIDITASPIREVDFVAGPVNMWREIKTYGHYAYVVTEDLGAQSGVHVIDLSTLPDSVSLVSIDQSVISSVHTIQIDGHYLYAMGTVLGGAVIMDLEPDPLHPRIVGIASQTYFHDAFIRNDTLVGAAIYGGGCEIWDISDKSSPRQLAAFNYPGSGTHNASVTPDGRYLLTSDEIGGTQKSMKVWDIGDLDNITKVAEFTPDPVDIVHNVYSIGRYAFASWYTAGVRVIDMIDPTNPREVGYYDTYAGVSGGFSGAWEVYARFPSGKIIASDRQTGLWVFRFNGATAVDLSGVVRDSITGLPLAGAAVRIESGPLQTTDASGSFRSGSSSGRTIELTASAFGYIPKVESVVLDGNVQHDILLARAPMQSVKLLAVDTLGMPIDSFSWSIFPHILSSFSEHEATISLPSDSTYSAYVGKWGYVPRLATFTVTAGTEVRVALKERYQDDARLDLGWDYGDPAQAYTFGRVWLSPENSADRIAPRLQATGIPGEVFSTITAAAPGSERDLHPPARIAGDNVTLTTPVMDLHDLPEPLIIFDIWAARGNPGSVGDLFRVELSNDNGTTWLPVPAVTEQNRWWRVRIAPKEYLPLTSSMKMRLTAIGSNGAEPLVAIDNFFLTPNGAAGVATPAHVPMRTLEILPNPVKVGGIVELRPPAGSRIARTEMFDLQGKRIAILEPLASHTFDSPWLHLLPSGIPAGWYFMRATGTDGSNWGRGIVVE